VKTTLLIGITLLLCTPAVDAYALATAWVEGTNYVLLNPTQRTQVAAGKVEVLEVFSYGCPACNAFQPVMDALARRLPANAQIALLPVSFSAAEDMPMLQRAFFAAQTLRVAEKAHQAMFDAVWKTGELAVTDPITHRLKSSLPTLEDAARCYGRITGVKSEEFLRAARSFGVDIKMRSADAQVNAMQVPGTPCLVVDGKYRVELDTLRGPDDVIDLVNYLVSLASRRSERIP
jgi:protein dithiol oxidoreductase (disulfide-forming)